MAAGQNLDEALEFIGDRAEPLAVYLFSHDESVKRRGKTLFLL